MKNYLILTAAFVLVLLAIGCGGNGGVPPVQTGNLTGTVYAPNGTDPVSGALAYVAVKSGSAVGDPPTEPYEAFDYSDADGTFVLTDVPVGIQTIIIIKGAFTKQSDFDVQAGDNVLPVADTTLPSASGGGDTVEKMVVVTGAYDQIQNVLAKLGLGDVDSVGALVLGTETFTLVDGDNTLDDADYANFSECFTDPTFWAPYRTIFINCGVHDYEFDFFANADAVNSLRSWVEDGGRLYVTDQAYDFVEQLFPTYIDYYGTDPGFAATPEALSAAEMGDDFVETDATVLDADLLAWLQTSAIAATNADDTVTIEGWLSSWVPMDAVSGDVTPWVEAPVMVDLAEATRTVTVTFSPGDGTVFYSSYHTEEEPVTTLNPQERVLQYFVFEVL